MNSYIYRGFKLFYTYLIKTSPRYMLVLTVSPSALTWLIQRYTESPANAFGSFRFTSLAALRATARKCIVCFSEIGREGTNLTGKLTKIELF